MKLGPIPLFADLERHGHNVWEHPERTQVTGEFSAASAFGLVASGGTCKGSDVEKLNNTPKPGLVTRLDLEERLKVKLGAAASVDLGNFPAKVESQVLVGDFPGAQECLKWAVPLVEAVARRDGSLDDKINLATVLLLRAVAANELGDPGQASRDQSAAKSLLDSMETYFPGIPRATRERAKILRIISRCSIDTLRARQFSNYGTSVKLTVDDLPEIPDVTKCPEAPDHLESEWKWVKRARRALPQLVREVEQLRGRFYSGCGFHYSLESQLFSLVREFRTLTGAEDLMELTLLRIFMESLFKDCAEARASVSGWEDENGELVRVRTPLERPV